MAESWQPQEDSLRQILQLLKEAKSPDNSTQSAVLQTWDVLKEDPVFNNHLTFVLIKLTSEDEVTRSLSGSFLKKNIQDDFQNFPPAVVNYIRNECLSGLADPSPRIRATVVIIVKTVVSTGGLDNWPDLLPKLCQMLDSTEDQAVCEGALDALQKICEVSMGELLQGLMHLAAGDDVKVFTSVRRAFVELVPLMDEIIECMVDLIQEANDADALGACKLWLSLAMNESETICQEVLSQQHLTRLLPLLLKWMRFSDREIILLKADVEEDHHDSNDEDDEGDNGSDDDDLSHWNLRKSSAGLLDALSNVFKDELVPVLLPLLKEMLYHPEWIIQESGILALGAVSEGCKKAMEGELVELVPFLISCLSDKNALVRAITCWTLARYADWMVKQPHDQYLKPLITELFKRVLDGNKRVQEAACSALATIEEEAGAQLVPYLGDILEALVGAYDQDKQRKSLLCLYDAIGTLALSVGSHLNKSEYIDLLMPRLFAKWNALEDEDKDLIPLLECLSSVAKALKLGFLPYCETVFRRCTSLVEQTLNQHIEQQPDQFEAPNKDFMVAALDLISGLTEGLGSHIERLIVTSNLIQLLRQSMEDTVPEVRQSAFALLGDLTKACFDQVVPCLPELLPILSQNLGSEFPFVCINATWALGEIAVMFGNEMRVYIPLFLTQLISTINRPDKTTLKAIMVNTAVTLGRLGYACPQDVAPHLQQFTERWSMSMLYSEEDDEKDTAFRGMCKMMAVNENGFVLRDFLYFCKSMLLSCDNPRSDLKEQFTKILESFKRCVSDENWNRFLGHFEPPLRGKMMKEFGV